MTANLRIIHDIRKTLRQKKQKTLCHIGEYSYFCRKMKKRVRIVYIIDSLASKGGAERILTDKMNYMASQWGWEVHVVTCYQDAASMPNAYELSAHVKQTNLQIPYHSQYRYGYPRRLWEKWRIYRSLCQQLAATVQRIDPDVLIGLGYFQADVVVGIKCRAMKVIESHEARIFTMSDDGLGRSWLSRLYMRYYKQHYFRDVERKADVVVALTEGDAREWRKARRVEVIPNFTVMNGRQSLEASPAEERRQSLEASPTKGRAQSLEASPTEGRRQSLEASPAEGLQSLEASPTKGWRQSLEASPTKGRQSLEASPTTTYKRVLAVGRLEWQKGFDRLIDVWAMIATDHPDWRLDIFGSGTLEKELRARIRQAGLDSQTSVHPFTKNIADEYAASSVFALSSRFEGFGLVLLEAMQHGVPCVVFDCPFGPSDVVVDGECGFVVPDGDIPAFARQLARLMDDDELRCQFAAAAVERVKRFSVDIVMEQWRQLLIQ